MTSSPVFAVHPDILRFEEEIRNLTDDEITGFFTPDGVLLLRLEGTCVPREGCRTIIPDSRQKAIAGQIMTHNHPSEASFTARDLMEASYFSLKEVRVVGKTVVYSMQPGPEGWPSPRRIMETFERIWESPGLMETVGRIVDEKTARMDDTLDSGEQMASIRLRVRSDLCCRELAQELHLIYRKAVWPP
ncbi:hypothetical protein [Methanovulcanius yangii]|uniref:hypothetical protein n=1 Tax=Methanovulcanius yangii TaxID=1789227 RepID=UPI0029CA2FC9|nr:hypothetical protein [Methanovulcanius yangii]